VKDNIAEQSKDSKDNLILPPNHGGGQANSSSVFSASNIQYGISERIAGLNCGGIGAVHTLVKKIGLDETIDQNIHLLKIHNPYRESDHILNIIYNILCGGHCLEDLELLRNDEAYLKALGAFRIPDPTTAGDFLRRFECDDVVKLMSVGNHINQKVWDLDPANKKRSAIIDPDGTIAETYGECKEQMDMSYKGKWGFSPLSIMEAQTGAHLFLVNRSGNAVSHEGAAPWMDKAIDVVKDHFAGVYLRGDSDFSLTEKFDEWDGKDVKFCFSYDAHPNLVKKAEMLPKNVWKSHNRKERRIKTVPRGRKHNVKEEVVKKRGYENKKRGREYVAEFGYGPVKCDREYRIVVIRRVLKVTRGRLRFEDEVRYFFHITNIEREEMSAGDVVRFNRGRCNHENKIEQLYNGVRALKMPCSEFVANWAYMVICSLAWNLKSWMGQVMPDRKRGEEVIRMEFRRFMRVMINIPCQILKSGRRLWFRILNWSPWTDTFRDTFRRIKDMRFAPY